MRNLIWRGIARVVSQTRVADWLIRRALKTPFNHLPTNDDPSYMERYWLFNPYPVSSQDRKLWQFPWSIRLHFIKRPDSDRHLHDHPWNARTIILKGWYAEKRLLTPVETQEVIRDADIEQLLAMIDPNPHIEATEHFVRLPGHTTTLRVGEYHSITEVSDGGVWTMFITGPWKADWGFLVDGVKIWWRTYLGQEKTVAAPNELSKLEGSEK